MASIELWRGQSKNLTISNLQTDTLKNGHISKYVFDSDNSGNTELNGCGQLENAKTTITAITSVNQSKQYNISAYLLYSHKFPGSETTYATSNKDVTTLTVKEPLDGTSLTGLNINGENWVWSNAESKEFIITPSFATANPFSKNGEYVTNATTQTNPIGYVTTIPSGAADITAIKLKWNKSTGNSTDLGSGEQTINVNVKSTEESAPIAAIISTYSATLTVRNAVTELHGLSNAEIYARATTQISQTVTFTPENPYSNALELVGENDQQITSNSINIDGAVLQLSDQTVTLNASGATNTVDKTFKFKIRSIQGARNVDTSFITFTLKAVADIAGQEVVEGQNITVDAGIGDIKSVEVLSGPVTAAYTGASVSITGTAVDADTPWTVKVTNNTGAHITISGTTKRLADKSVNINTGDYITIGTDILTGLTTPFEIVHDAEHQITGTAAIVDNVLRYDASTVDGPIAAGEYPIKVKGANGATQTVNVVVSYINTTPSEPEPDYLCFTSTGDSKVGLSLGGSPSGWSKPINYKINNGEWKKFGWAESVSLSNNDKMYVKSDDTAALYADLGGNNITYIGFTIDSGSIAISGDITSLYNFIYTINIPFKYRRIFKDCTAITDITNLKIPDTTLADSCYYDMFSGCTSLVTAPELPATILARDCYRGMFSGCTSLTTAPELPVTTLADSCYYGMFNGCTSLVTAPELPATNLENSCYFEMFSGCISLVTAPELPATVLTHHCYQDMFSGCAKLNYVKALFVNIPSYEQENSPIRYWLDNVSTTGTFVKSKDATWRNTDAEIPTSWTVQTA